MKILGAIMIVSAAISFGISKNRRIRKAIHTKEAMLFSVQILKSELAANRSTVPEILKRITDVCSGEIRNVYKNILEELSHDFGRSFSDIWQENMDNIPCDDRSCIEGLIHLGQKLGRYDVNEQIEEAERCLAILKLSIEKDTAEYNRTKKSNLTVPPMFAAITVIMLI